jgi:dienelactone hydrolase
VKAFLALFAALQAAGLMPVRVTIPGPNGLSLNAVLVRPTGPVKPPAAVALHGCAGPIPARETQWAKRLVETGHIVLFPDSFGSRGLGPQCRATNRTVTESGLRRQDAIAAAEWLRAQPEVRSGGVALIGWSNGGGTVLYTAEDNPPPPPGLFSRFVAFYPGCRTVSQNGWAPSGPLLLLVGANDDWTPAGPCELLAKKYPKLITLVVYPDAWHDFDRPGVPVRKLTGLVTPPSGTGQAHEGTNEAARRDALNRVPEFIAGYAP